VEVRDYGTEEIIWIFGLKFVFLGRHLEETLISLIELRFGGYFQVNFGRAALQSFSVTWILRIYSAFTPGEREKATDKLYRFGT